MYQGNLLSVFERHFWKMPWYVDAPEPQCVRNFTAVRNRELGSSRGSVAKSRMKHCPEFDGAARSQCCTFESFRHHNDAIVQPTTWKARSCRSMESSGVMGHSVTFRWQWLRRCVRAAFRHLSRESSRNAQRVVLNSSLVRQTSEHDDSSRLSLVSTTW